MIKWENVESISIPSGVSFRKEGATLICKGKMGEVSRLFLDNYVRVNLEDGKITIERSKNNKYTLGICGTWKAEIKNMIEGVQTGFSKVMKVDYTHFPIRVSVKSNTFVVENFLGERSPRIAKIVGKSTKVSIKGDRVTITGIDKREIGETSANIERATKIKGFDLRVFQDGIFPIEEEAEQ